MRLPRVKPTVYCLVRVTLEYLSNKKLAKKVLPWPPLPSLPPPSSSLLFLPMSSLQTHLPPPSSLLPPPPRLPSSSYVSASVAFNPSGNFDFSLFDDQENTGNAPPPRLPTHGRFDVVLTDHSIRRLGLSPLTSTIPHLSPHQPGGGGLGGAKELLGRTVGFTINFV